MSGVSREGLIDVLRAVRGQIDADKLRRKEEVEEPGPWRP